MKKFALLAILLLCLVGCVNQAFVKGVDSGLNVILPRYIEYIQNDSRLDDESKAERIRTANQLRKLVDEAKE